MKQKETLALFLILFLIGGSLYAQKSSQKSGKQLSGLKIATEFISSLRAENAEPFRIEIDGVLRAARGYKMMYNAKANTFMIYPSSVQMAAVAKGATTKDLPGGAQLRCSGCNKCAVTEIASSGKGKVYGCGGSCPDLGCMASVSVPSAMVAQYSTGGGDWMNN